VTCQSSDWTVSHSNNSRAVWITAQVCAYLSNAETDTFHKDEPPYQPNSTWYEWYFGVTKQQLLIAKYTILTITVYESNVNRSWWIEWTS